VTHNRHVRGTDVSDEVAEYVIKGIKLNFIWNMTAAGSFETSLIFYRSTRPRNTVFNILFINSKRML
jgi:hypothetical protein